jgi:hypothetical protein
MNGSTAPPAHLWTRYLLLSTTHRRGAASLEDSDGAEVGSVPDAGVQAPRSRHRLEWQWQQQQQCWYARHASGHGLDAVQRDFAKLRTWEGIGTSMYTNALVLMLIWYQFCSDSPKWYGNNIAVCNTVSIWYQHC